MGDATKISWTDATWNPVRGCSRVSEGCRNCYAERVAIRFGGEGQPYAGLVRLGIGGDRLGWNGVVRLIPEHLADPLRWKKPRRIFVNSMSDLFHERLTNEQIAAVFGAMAAASHHTFQVLTKRAKRMREWFAWAGRMNLDELQASAIHVICMNDRSQNVRVPRGRTWPLPNVWLGVSVENQAAADERIPELLATPAVVRFLSCEPLIGAVDLEHVRHALGERSFEIGSVLEGNDGFGLSAPRAHIDWVIAGCESGPGARNCDVAWLRSLRDQCAAAGTAFFLKQAVAHSYTVLGSDNELHGVWEIGAAQGSKLKGRGAGGGVIELPYLDGVQHAEFPEVSP